jgi:hypothetical protein
VGAGIRRARFCPLFLEAVNKNVQVLRIFIDEGLDRGRAAAITDDAAAPTPRAARRTSASRQLGSSTPRTGATACGVAWLLAPLVERP